MLKLGHILPIWYDMLLKVQHINKLCGIQKSQRSVKHIWFLPTLKPNAEKTKRACPFPTHDKTMNNYTVK